MRIHTDCTCLEPECGDPDYVNHNSNCPVYLRGYILILKQRIAELEGRGVYHYQDLLAAYRVLVAVAPEITMTDVERALRAVLTSMEEG